MTTTLSSSDSPQPAHTSSMPLGIGSRAGRGEGLELWARARKNMPNCDVCR